MSNLSDLLLGGTTVKVDSPGSKTISLITGQQPAFGNYFDRVNQSINNAGNLAGKVTLGFNPTETGAQQSLINLGTGTLPANAQAGWDALLPSLSGTSSDQLNTVINAALKPVVDQLQKNILPSITQGFGTAGQRGAGRGDAFQQTALTNFGRTAADVSANLAYTDFANSMARQLQAAQLIPTINQQMLLGPQTVADVGAAQRDLSQAQADTAYQNQFLPLQELGILQGLIGSPVETGVTSTASQTQTSQGNPLEAIVGALGLADAALSSETLGKIAKAFGLSGSTALPPGDLSGQVGVSNAGGAPGAADYFASGDGGSSPTSVPTSIPGVATGTSGVPGAADFFSGGTTSAVPGITFGAPLADVSIGGAAPAGTAAGFGNVPLGAAGDFTFGAPASVSSADAGGLLGRSAGGGFDATGSLAGLGSDLASFFGSSTAPATAAGTAAAGAGLLALPYLANALFGSGSYDTPTQTTLADGRVGLQSPYTADKMLPKPTYLQTGDGMAEDGYLIVEGPNAGKYWSVNRGGVIDGTPVPGGRNGFYMNSHGVQFRNGQEVGGGR